MKNGTLPSSVVEMLEQFERTASSTIEQTVCNGVPAMAGALRNEVDWLVETLDQWIADFPRTEGKTAVLRVRTRAATLLDQLSTMAAGMVTTTPAAKILTDLQQMVEKSWDCGGAETVAKLFSEDEAEAKAFIERLLALVKPQ